MRTFTLLALPICLLASVAEAQIPTASELRRVGLERVWASQARVDPGSDKVAHVTVDERNCYVQATNGSLTAFDAERGNRKWTVQLGPANRTTFPATSNASTVVVVTGTTIFGVDKFSGNVEWTLQTPSSATTSATATDRFFYIGTNDGSVYCYRFDVVEYLGRTGRLPGTYNPTTRTVSSPIDDVASTSAWAWRYRSGRMMQKPPVLVGGKAVFGDFRGDVYVLTTGTRQELGGKLTMQHKAGHGLAGNIAARDNSVFVPTTDNRVVAVSVKKSVREGVETPAGTSLWSFGVGHSISGGPDLIGDRLYVGSTGEGLLALDPIDGSQIPSPTGEWWIPGASSLIGVTESLVLASGSQNTIIAADRATGRPRGMVRLDAYPIRVTNTLNDRIYMASEQGLVICCRQPGSDEPTFYRDLDKALITPEMAEETKEDRPELVEGAEDGGDSQ